MHLLQPHPMSINPTSPALSNDEEMLQTDVMRFFAILCLCLMAIFALVKALPMAPPGDKPTIAAPTDLKAETYSLQIQIAGLKRKLAQTQTQVQAASSAAEQSSLQAEKAAKDEEEILTRLARSRQDLKNVSQSLEETRGELTTRELKLAEILNAIENKERIHSGLSSEINRETQNLKKIQAALTRAREKVNRSHHQDQHSEKIPAEATPPRQPVRQEYTLRFASDAALQTLISQGKVNFYAVAGNKAWQLRLIGGRPDYISAQNPLQIYEMDNATVPLDYAAAFQQQIAAFGRTTVTWGVTLPAQTTASINRFIKGQTGGLLVIMPDGEVRLN